ncbi:GcrA family cell cycle regulator [Maritalea sp.]|uniref:GcrA family cell cycle regulator n=1 Tax=Maritalea sp. TaxID=2003361 RepID=UPI003EF4A4C7
MGFSPLDFRSGKPAIAAKRTDMNTVATRRRMASKKKEAAKLNSREGVHLLAAKSSATALRNSAAFDPSHAPDGALFLPLGELGECDCRWPLYRDGEIQLFCGRYTVPSKSYCEVHHKVAYRPYRRMVL